MSFAREESMMSTGWTATAARVPVLSSAEDAIAAARAYVASIADGAIERDRAATCPMRSWRRWTPAACSGSRSRPPTAAPTSPRRRWPR